MNYHTFPSEALYESFSWNAHKTETYSKLRNKCIPLSQMICLLDWFLVSVTWSPCTHRSFTACSVLPAAAIGCRCGPFIPAFPFSSFPLQTVDSLSNKKQMGDLCCRLLPNVANSHYNVCKLCLFSPRFPSTPCTILPLDVFNTCFQRRRVILMCLV